MRIRNQFFYLVADPYHVFHLSENQDPGSQTNADQSGSWLDCDVKK